MLPGSAGPSLALPVSPAAIGTAADGIDSVITMARRGGGARAGGGARVSHSAGVSRSARVGHGARVSHAKVNRTTNVRTRTNVNVNRVTNVNVGRGLVRPWVRRPYYGTIVGGVALGAVIAAGAIGGEPAEKAFPAKPP